MRANQVLRAVSSASAMSGLSNTGDSWQCQSAMTNVNSRGVAPGFIHNGENAAVYDSALKSWHYLAPVEKVDIECMPAPDAKYYQVNTKRDWDISCQEHQEIRDRSNAWRMIQYVCVFIIGFYIIPKERNYSGRNGSDGFWIGLPKQRPELFQ